MDDDGFVGDGWAGCTGAIGGCRWPRGIYAARRFCKGLQRDGVGPVTVENKWCAVLHAGDSDGFGDEENDTDEVALI